MPATGSTPLPISLGTSITKVGEEARCDLVHFPSYPVRKVVPRVHARVLPCCRSESTAQATS